MNNFILFLTKETYRKTSHQILAESDMVVVDGYIVKNRHGPIDGAIKFNEYDGSLGRCRECGEDIKIRKSDSGTYIGCMCSIIV